MSRYEVHCECGRAIPVGVTEAGSAMACGCGRTVQVPTLSKLRVAKGESAVPQNAIERIEARIRAGELPDNRLCPHSGRPVNETVLVCVQCETVWRRRHGYSTASHFLIFLAFGWLGTIFTSKPSVEEEEHGRDTVVFLPLRVSSDASEEVLRMGSRQLRELLCQTPAYNELFQDYPEAKVARATRSQQ